MSEFRSRVRCKRAGIRAAVALIGLLHRSRKQRNERENLQAPGSQRKQELLTISSLPLADYPPSPPRTAPASMKTTPFFDSLEKMEDDYIPNPSIQQVLEQGAPYPQVIQPKLGGYWIEDSDNSALIQNSWENSYYHDGDGEGENPGGLFGYRLESNYAIQAYRKHFLGKEHLNFYCMASNHGNLILSLRHEETKDQEYLHIILRTASKTIYDRISLIGLNELPSIPQLVKVMIILL